MEQWYILWQEDIKYNTKLSYMTVELLIKNIELSFRFLLQGSHFHKFNTLKVHTGEICSEFMTGFGEWLSSSDIVTWHLLHAALFWVEDSSFLSAH